MKIINMIIVAVLIYTSLGVSICCGESKDVSTENKVFNEIRWKVGQITIDESKAIKQIENMTSTHDIDGLCGIYQEDKDNFLSIIVLDKLRLLRSLERLSDPSNKFLTFAKIMQSDGNDISLFLNTTDDPGLKIFLKSWYANQKDFATLPEEFKSLRTVKIKQIETQIKDPNVTKAELLFNIIENWKSPLEYEACYPLILKEYKQNPEPVLNLLKQLLLKYTSNQVPPPYTKAHTVFHELCFIAVLINDKSLVDFILPLSHSNNPFVAYKCSMVLKWLQEGVEYPFEYNKMKRLYNSRS